LKIVVATLARPLGDTGIQTHFNSLLDYLRSEGQEAVLVTPFSWNKLAASLVFSIRRLVGWLNPSIDVWWYETWHYVFLKLALRQVLRKESSVAVYAQTPLAAKAALRARTGPHQSVSMAVHYNVSQADEWAFQLGLSRNGSVYRAIRQREVEILPSVDGLIFVSNFAKTQTEEAIPETRRVKSIVLPNFVSLPLGDTSSRAAADLISIGTLEPRKNQAYLIKTVAEANKLGRRYSLILVGNGPDEGRLRALAKDLGVEEQVEFLGFQPNARRLLPGNRVYAHSAVQENFGIALIEGMAAGLPICAGAVGGTVEAFSDGTEGFFWDLSDPSDGAQKLLTLLETPGLHSRMSAAARARFAANFETRIVAGRLTDFLLGRSLQEPDPEQ
jgi:glycosyltransferase involved in cell wall biosynthesis